MKKTITSLAVLALSGFAAYAQQDADKPAVTAPETSGVTKAPADPNAAADRVADTDIAMPHDLVATNRLQGAGVKNAAGEEIGTISQFLFDSMTGQVHFAVISTGGFLGLGQLEIPVPWKSLNMQTVEGEEKLYFSLNATKEQLEKAPQFHADRQDEFDTVSQLDAVYTYWGVERPMKSGLRALDSTLPDTTSPATPALPANPEIPKDNTTPAPDNN